MTEHYPTQQSPQILTEEQFNFLLSIGKAPTPRPRPQNTPSYSRPYLTPPAPKLSYERSRPATQEHTPKQKRRLTKVAKSAIGASVALAVASGAVLAAHQSGISFDSFTEFFSSTPEGNATSDLGSGMNITELEPLGIESLKDTQCYLPGAVLMILTIDGYSPIVPVLPGTEQAPYMTEDVQDQQGIAKDVRKTFEPFNTEDGYNHATLNDLPLYVTACSTSPNAVQTMGDGSYKIDRSGISMNFQDPNRLFDSTELVWTKKQDTGAIVETNPEQGEYMTVPMSMYIGQREGDDAFNTAATALNQSMQDPAQLALMLATMQTDVVGQIDNVVDGQENIHYPSGVSQLEEAMDAALRVHLGIDSNAKIDWTGNYPVSMDVERIDGKPITEGRTLSNFKLDPFKITDVQVKYGTPTEPKPRPKPSPTETQNAAPAN